MKLTDSTHRDITFYFMSIIYIYIKDIVDIQQLWKNHSKLKHLTNEYKLFYKKVNMLHIQQGQNPFNNNKIEEEENDHQTMTQEQQAEKEEEEEEVLDHQNMPF